MSDQVRLTYFDGRGLGEAIRLLLCDVGIKFRDTFLKTREDYLKLCEEGKLQQFNQLPLLEIDGLCLVQQRPILLYVARKSNLLGDNEEDFVKIIMFFEGLRDAVMPFITIGFVSSQADSLASLEEQVLPKYLPVFEKALADNGSGNLVGRKRSLADVCLLELLILVEEYFTVEQLNDYPNLKGYLLDQKKREEIANYIQEVRRPKTSPEYVQTVKTVLSHKYGSS